MSGLGPVCVLEKDPLYFDLNEKILVLDTLALIKPKIQIYTLFSEFRKSFDKEQYSKKLSERWKMKVPMAFFTQLSL